VLQLRAAPAAQRVLDEQLTTVAKLAKDNELPYVILTESELKITPWDAAGPDTAQALIDKTSQLRPRIKITELLIGVDEWTASPATLPT